jgi:hypothetical protein
MKKMTTSFAVTAALLSGVATADTNPFGATELSSGYMQLAEAEMACGANMKMDTPPPKTAEGACAGKKTDAKTAEAKKAAEEKAAAEAAAKAKR